jgi:hypothetical protein
VAISTTTAHTGLCAGLFTVSTSSTSRAYISKDLGGSKTDVWASGWFDVAQEGVPGSNVPYLRFFDGSNRIADVYRQNVTGDAWLRTLDGSGGWSYVKLNSPRRAERHLQHRSDLGRRRSQVLERDVRPAHNHATHDGPVGVRARLPTGGRVLRRRVHRGPLTHRPGCHDPRLRFSVGRVPNRFIGRPRCSSRPSET